MTKRGFTLIELLIVVAIIGILAGIVLFTLNPTGAQNRAKNAVLAANLEKLSTAAKAAYVSNISGTQAYPATSTALIATGMVDAMPSDAQGGTIVYFGNTTDFCTSGQAAGSGYLVMTESSTSVQEETAACTAADTY